jgi:hypothetical protein
VTPERKILWGVVVGVAILVVVLFSTARVEREIAPQLKAAWVGVEIESSGLARTGRVEISSGTSFQLHAVVEAETFRGKTVYYTKAARLEINAREIPQEALRVWRRTLEPRILWFTVEGFKPFMEIGAAADLEQFRFEEFFRPDWPRTWVVPGNLQPRSERALRSVPLGNIPRFGIQRYHVRVEVFGPESDITPQLRLRSMQAVELPAKADSFTTVIATSPGALEAPSRVFGLTQIEPTPDSLASTADRLASWSREQISFSRLTVLRDLLERSGVTYDQLEWQSIDLAAGPIWGADGVDGGDLLRVGDRWVVLFHDEGQPGILDREDLCLDFDKGARIRRMVDVFTGDGLVNWAAVPDSSS